MGAATLDRALAVFRKLDYKRLAVNRFDDSHFSLEVS